MLCASMYSFAQGDGELVSSDVVITKDCGYRMFIKDYSDAIIEQANAGKKFAIRFKSEDENIVRPEGNIFRGISIGSCGMTMQMSTVYEGTLDAFDEGNILMEKQFNVTVTEDEAFVVPTFELSWGLSRAEHEANQKSWGHEQITDKYLGHTPNVIENNPEYVKQVEVFYNNNFEAPITISQFTEEGDQLVATSILIGSWEKVTSTSSYLYNWLVEKGFTSAAPEPPYWNLIMKHDGVITHASWESVVIDNVWYPALMLNYDGVDETGIEDVKDELVKFDLQTAGTTIRINAPEFAGKKVTLSDVSGKLLSVATIMNGGNEFNVPAHGMYIVKIDGVKAVKVML